MTTETLDFPVLQAGRAADEAKSAKTRKTLSNVGTVSDFELTQAAAGGDMVAFEEIYQRHHRQGLFDLLADASECIRSGRSDAGCLYPAL